MISRFSYGSTAGLRKAVAEAGGPREWFNAQLQPTGIPDQAADAMKDWFPYGVPARCSAASPSPAWSETFSLKLLTARRDRTPWWCHQRETVGSAPQTECAAR
jgi:hypothetical protein